MFAAAALGVLVCMGLALARAVLGPTVYDRILAANVFGTLTVLIIAVLGFMTGRPDFLDIALVYALINFISTIAVLKFVRYGDMGSPRDIDDDHPGTTNGNTD
jgi:multicomponent Na+:H+ antiporter subunit F